MAGKVCEYPRLSSQQLFHRLKLDCEWTWQRHHRSISASRSLDSLFAVDSLYSYEIEAAVFDPIEQASTSGLGSVASICHLVVVPVVNV